jgi:hypothetical protein
MKSMLHELQGDVMLVVQGDVPVVDGDWDEYLAALDASPSLKAFLISADNHGPNASQRAKLATLHRIDPLPKAVVTTSMGARGIVTALSWLGSNIRAFAPNQIDRAFDYLGVANDARAALLGRLALLKTWLAGGEKLDQFRGSESGDHADLPFMQQIVEERVANIRAKLRAAPRRS